MSGSLHSPNVSISSSNHPGITVPLLSLAPPALALGDDLTLGQLGAEHNAGDIWNVISRASDLVKDGRRLENLAWRHWAQPPPARRASISTAGTGSSTSLHTPIHELPLALFDRPRGSGRRSFGGALRLLMEEDNFKDWIDDAKRNVPIPYLSVPDTPIAEVEIRLVEPTPVPSRVGSLGGSSAAGGLFVAAVVPPKLSEAEEEVNDEDSEGEGAIASSSKVLSRPRARSPRKKGKFFLHSSPSKGSALDSPHPSPVPADDVVIPTMPQPQRRSSGSSSSAVLPKPKEKEKQHVSLSTMQGKFQAEKRRAARAIAEGENSSDASGWENEVEEQDKSDEGWSDEPDSPEKQKRPKRRLSFHSRPGRSASNLDLTNLLTRQTSRHTPPQVPPPPAPTPLRKMSKKQRLAAAAERTQIEAELDAQRKREMFAKQQIFGGQPAGEGLLSRVFKSGGSMVDLTQASESGRTALRPSPTHGNLPSLARSPTVGPTLLRSKSAVAIPVQSGVSVTISHGVHKGFSDNKKERSGKNSFEKSFQRAPHGVTMESSDEESGDDFLATSQTQRKIAELAVKREARTQPVAAAYRLDENGVVPPLSPTTRRRGIIMREMSESLRHNLILERHKSSAGLSRQNLSGQQPTRLPPSNRTSVLPARSSAINLSQQAQGAVLARHHSQPLIYNPAPISSPTPVPALQTAINPEASRRRAQPNILGGGFLRPLTRVGENSPLSRTQSSAALSHIVSDTSPPKTLLPLSLEAPAMVRRSTEGDGRASSHEIRRRELAKRTETMDTSYRIHGW